MAAAAAESDSAMADPLIRRTTFACNSADEWLGALREYPGALGIAAEHVGPVDLQAVCPPESESPVCADARVRGLFDATPAPLVSARPLGRAVCEHFHNIVVDVVDGQLTYGEFRLKMREVVDDSFGINDVIEDAAKEVVRRLTAGEPIESAPMDAAFGRISDECDRVLDR